MQLSAAAVGVELGLTPEQVKAGIEGFRATKNRMSIETTKDGITILNDVYNSNPVSCKASLDILANAKGRRIAVLGFMGELGDYAEEGHREVGIHAAEKGIDVLYCIGLCCDYMADAGEKGRHERGLLSGDTGRILGEGTAYASKKAIRFCSRHPAAENLKKQ